VPYGLTVIVNIRVKYNNDGHFAIESNASNFKCKGPLLVSGNYSVWATSQWRPVLQAMQHTIKTSPDGSTTQVRSFWATLWGRRGNVHTSSSKACGRLLICDNWTFSLTITVQQKDVEISFCWRVWVSLRLNIRLMHYVYCQHIYTVR